MKKLLPIIIAVLGLAGGLTAGTFLKPQAHASDGHGDTDGVHGDTDTGHGDTAGSTGKSVVNAHQKYDEKSDNVYVGLKKPFFAPVINANNRNTLVRLDIHLEVPAGLEEKIEKHEPKLRDGFLRAVMNFAHEGGFARVHGSEGFEVLSDDLLLSARHVLGDKVRAVLIGEILTREG